jgi:diguanylate cyclase (GGDEF)-like protein/PAS domain S-box-containing protein
MRPMVVLTEPPALRTAKAPADPDCRTWLDEAGMCRFIETSAAPTPPELLKPTGAGTVDDLWFRQILEALPVAVYTVDPAGRLTFFNKAAARLAGRKPRLQSDTWCVAWKLLRRDGTDLPREDSPLALALRDGRSGEAVEAMAERPDGCQIPLLMFPTPIRNAEGDLIGGMNLLLDITDQKLAEARIDYLSRHDLLTGLPNQAAFERHLETLLDDPSDQGNFALVSLDLDGFARVNDLFGRQVGDQAMRALGLLLNRLPPSIRCFRPGGDNIFMTIPGCPDEALVRQILTELAAGWAAGLAAIRPALRVTFCAGIAFHRQDGAAAPGLVASAKAALLRAKRTGRGAIRCYDLKQDQLNRDRQLLNDDLRAAIGTEQLSLHYQPIARQGGTITGFEALIRWTHPQHGRLSPELFIPIAEDSGLIIPLSAWILRTACAEATTWRDSLGVSVNLSPAQFEQADLVDLVRAILAETGLPPERLTLEVTESLLISNYARAMGVLRDLRAIGIGISLDDFGTGYSSLSYLHEFPLSQIKIDKSFITTLGLSRRSEAILRSVIDLGHALDLRVVIEGVERQDQLNFIETTDCDLVQGYLIGRPLSGAETRRLSQSTAMPEAGTRG